MRRLAQRRPLLQVIAAEGRKSVQLTERRRPPHPLQHLPVGHHVDVLHGEHLIEEADEALHVVLRKEPPRVEEHAERRLVAGVVAIEVEFHHVVHALLIRGVVAAVGH